ncbi:hypothetical protein [Piscirickettsia litoralis]|uniref:Uncharacterized protein n=1 Tax=Piscirickettsia litoralis TaxID=1891921 RepID=A0ABX3A5J3_9GAMM|nr:hypothetical protein [Piscirickettsia litoralis]ODN42951.1 hypothetical protein BGC07_08485 [Piscirickettsia litoralis]
MSLPETHLKTILEESAKNSMRERLLSDSAVNYGSEHDEHPGPMPANSSTLPLRNYQTVRAQQTCAQRAWNRLCAVGRFFKNTVAPAVRSTLISTASTIGSLAAVDGGLKLAGYEGIYDDDPTALLTALSIGVIGSLGYGVYNHGYYGPEPTHPPRAADQDRYPGKTVTVLEAAFVLGEINIAMAEIIQMASENEWFKEKVKEDPIWLAVPIVAGLIIGGGLAATYFGTNIGSMAYPRLTGNERGEYQGKLYNWVTDPNHPERASRFKSFLATMFGATVHGYPTLQGLQNMGAPAPAAMGVALFAHLAGQTGVTKVIGTSLHNVLTEKGADLSHYTQMMTNADTRWTDYAFGGEALPKLVEKMCACFGCKCTPETVNRIEKAVNGMLYAGSMVNTAIVSGNAVGRVMPPGSPSSLERAIKWMIATTVGVAESVKVLEHQPAPRVMPRLMSSAHDAKLDLERGDNKADCDLVA